MLSEGLRAQGWIEHDGGAMPACLAAKRVRIVEAMFDNGVTLRNYADVFTWRDNPNRPPRLIAYKPETPDGR